MFSKTGSAKHKGKTRSAVFYPVVTNRDYLKIENRKNFLWEFLDLPPHGFLTSCNKTVNTEIPSKYQTIFDCGAWGYRKQEVPPIDANSIYDSYRKIARPKDVLTAPDHMIIPDTNIEYRKKYNLAQAEIFFDIVDKTSYEPMATVHGLSVSDRLESAKKLQEIGYSYLAIGGLAARARQKEYVINAVSAVKNEFPDAKIHVFGISSPSYVKTWKKIGVTSFDGSSYFLKALTKGIWVDRQMNTHKINTGSLLGMKKCECKSCRKVFELGGDTRRSGNSINNIGRAIHNLNMLLWNI